MRKLLLAAGAAAIAIAMPATAKPGKGGGHAGAHGKSGTVVSGGKARTDLRAAARARTRTGVGVVRIRDRDGDGIPDHRDRVDNRAAGRYGVDACPPGLAAKANGCLPPGQARKIFNVGQRIPVGYNFYTPYGEIPLAYRDRYGLVTDGRYIYRDNSIYVVDPATSLVTRIIDLID
ncbi:MAG TPA: hypothetical protein VEA61_05710 [Allosphingosinicella sp.]|nr:hypothetical protein [Allosphingosinicella sp.]